jgi:transcription-repair coupling factor (superfamily II helicase)
LSLYKKLASCNDDDALIALREELIDRYGKLPEEARALIETHRLRLAAEQLGVRKIDASSELIVITFAKDAPIEPARLIALLQKQKAMRLAGPEKLRFEVKTPDLDARLGQLRGVFKSLSA